MGMQKSEFPETLHQAYPSQLTEKASFEKVLDHNLFVLSSYRLVIDLCLETCAMSELWKHTCIYERKNVGTFFPNCDCYDSLTSFLTLIAFLTSVFPMILVL